MNLPYDEIFKYSDIFNPISPTSLFSAGKLARARAKYLCRDIRKLRFNRTYDVVTSLGLGIKQVYNDISDALKFFKTMLPEGGFLILAEPVWMVKPISSEVLKALGEVEDSFLTCFELQQLMEKLGFQVKGHFVSTKEDWELYIKPVYIAMRELIESKSELAEEAQRVMNSFKAEYDAVGQHWNMVLWVVKAY